MAEGDVYTNDGTTPQWGPTADVIGANGPVLSDTGGTLAWVTASAAVAGGDNVLTQVVSTDPSSTQPGWAALPSGPPPSRVWITNSGGGAIATMAADGTVGPNVTHPDFLDGGVPCVLQGIEVVGDEVWVAVWTTNKVVRLKFDGTQAAPTITDAYLGSPVGIRVIGSVVHVTNQASSYPSGTNTNISRYNFDGSSAGTPLASVAVGSGSALYNGLCPVGSEEWVTSNNVTIYRLDGSGTVIGTINTADIPRDLEVVGSEVWATEGDSSRIERYNTSGGLVGTIFGPGFAQTAYLGIRMVDTLAWTADNAQQRVLRYTTAHVLTGSPYTSDQFNSPAYLVALPH